MYIGKEQEIVTYTRLSKTGLEHTYKRIRTLAVFRCDNCDELFRRELKKVSSKRLNNRYFHCCSNCDVKRFAQRKGVEQKKIWDMPASVELPVSKF